MIIPIYGMFVSKIGGSIIDAGIGYAIFSILTGILTIVSAKIKWFGENLELVVFLGFLISAVGDLSYVLVYNPIEMFFVQAANGISVGLLNPAWDTLYVRDTEDGEEHDAWSLWGGGVSISTGVAAIVGSVIASHFGFKAMFVTTVLINGTAVYCSYLIYKNRKKKKP